jgi:hypothetical protein
VNLSSPAEDAGTVPGVRRQAPEVLPNEGVGGVSPARLVEAGSDFLAAEDVLEGDVVSLVSAAPGSVVRSAGWNDPLVIGCVRGDRADGVGPGPVTVATSHIALCRVDAGYGAVAIGDRLVASPMPGAAMRADSAPVDRLVLGRAIEPLETGTARIRVLLGVR